MSDPVNGRFIVVERPPASPGVCFICKGIDGPMVDTQVTDSYLGVFYICKTCASEIAINLKVVVDASELQQVRAYQQGARDTAIQLQAAINEFQQRAVAGVLLDNAYPGPDSSGVLKSQGIPESDVREEGSGTSAGSTNKPANKSAKLSGPASIPDTTGKQPGPFDDL